MTRARTQVAGRRRHKKILKLAKGYWGGRSKRYRRAKETVMRAMAFSYRDRKTRKRNFRQLWITRVRAAARLNGLSYSRFINALSKASVIVNRKIMAELAVHHPGIFSALVKAVK
jgi:large subunit ribosomal protein L20